MVDDNDGIDNQEISPKMELRMPKLSSLDLEQIFSATLRISSLSSQPDKSPDLPDIAASPIPDMCRPSRSSQNFFAAFCLSRGYNPIDLCSLEIWTNRRRGRNPGMLAVL